MRTPELRAYIIYVKPPSLERLRETRQDSYITTNYYVNKPFKVFFCSVMSLLFLLLPLSHLNSIPMKGHIENSICILKSNKLWCTFFQTSSFIFSKPPTIKTFLSKWSWNQVWLLCPLTEWRFPGDGRSSPQDGVTLLAVFRPCDPQRRAAGLLRPAADCGEEGSGWAAVGSCQLDTT